MSIKIRTVDDSREWNDLVDRSPESTVFHRSEFLAIAEANSGQTLHRLAGYKGQEPIGLLPVFEINKKGFGAVFSPPPRMGILFQGPIRLNMNNLKQRKFERRNRRFVDACLEWLDEETSPRYVRVSTTTNYNDIRPFDWNDFSVIPNYTYELDLTPDIEEIKGNFSKSLRRYIKPRGETEFDVQKQGKEGIEFIHDQVEARYEAQDREYTVPLDFLFDLYDNLDDRSIHPYVAVHEGERIAGILVLQDDERIYFSEGGGKPDVDLPANDQLHWEIIVDANERGLTAYDLYGADIPRISEYKAKFNPTLKAYYEVENGTLITELASKIYRKIR